MTMTGDEGATFYTSSPCFFREFFNRANMKENITVAMLAELVDGEVIGDGEVLVGNFVSLETAGEGDITFLVKAGDQDLLTSTKAGAVIVHRKVEVESPATLIKVDDAYLAAAKIHTFLLEDEFSPEGIHRSAFVGEGCQISSEVTIKALVSIGNRVVIGPRTRIESGVAIGDDVTIGEDCLLKANVTIADGSQLGNGVTIHSGTVIGSDGYGYATDKMGFHYKRPQVGTVRVDDNVEIGANSCVDRATYGLTWIKSGAKIDNLVQIAHNVVVGENSLIVSQVGISGSTSLGRNVVMGGKAAAVGHLQIGDGVMIAGGSGVLSNLSAGAVVGGIPARPIKQWRKSVVLTTKLPEMQKDIRALKKSVEELAGKN
ncbi:probable UDP-3-O-[3-hydroxymyristoyl] glucosamine N-acyltransferase [Desulfotalea psychrophila LSv54]|nr:probable UDP-3-O-[3-hydroxymyristoyl] glucosamine N-acyltransferase [Desulfotalea psychrophila LSv54]